MTMTFKEYQEKALTTAIFNKDPLMDKTIWAMGISGEAGEILEKWKKILAYNDGNITDDDVTEIKKELGDVMWYIAVMAHSLDIPLEEVVELNVQKLADRKARGVQRGAGDNR